MDDGNDLQAGGALRPTSPHGGHFVARSLTARMPVAVEWQGGKNKITVTNVAAGQAAPVGCEIVGLLHWNFGGENPPSTEDKHTRSRTGGESDRTWLTNICVALFVFINVWMVAYCINISLF